MAIEPAAGGKPEPGPHWSGAEHFPWITVIIAAAVLGGIILLAIMRHRSAEAAQNQKKGGGGSNAPVSVIIGKVAQKDFSIFLDGLGTVQAFNAVTVRSRVDGQLKKVGFKEGQDVHAGDLLAEVDPAPFRAALGQAQAKKAQDQAQLNNAQLELKRDEKLLAEKIVAQDVYDTQKALAQQLEAAVQADQAAIDSAKVQLDYATITAPINGRTGLRLVDEGNIVRSADSNGIVVLTQLKPIFVLFTLPAQYLGDIQSQQAKGALTIVTLDRDNATPLDEGKLTVIDNQIDTSTGTIRLKGEFANEALNLWPGQFVNTRLLLSVRSNSLVVPASVVQRGPEGTYAFVVGEGNKVAMTKLKVGRMDRGQALIDEGLSAGQEVVVDGQYKLQPGATVRPAQTNAAANATQPEAKQPANAGKKSDAGKKKKTPAN
jgi:multidrug efflux system membrane fusion protein